MVYLSLELEWEKKENKQKEAGIGPFFKKIVPTNGVQEPMPSTIFRVAKFFLSIQFTALAFEPTTFRT